MPPIKMPKMQLNPLENMMPKMKETAPAEEPQGTDAYNYLPPVMMPAKMAKAILKVQMKLGALGKDGENQFQHFNFVSIDKYYEIVAKAATSEGLSWFCQEVSSKLVRMPTNNNDNAAGTRFEYVFTMFTQDGEVMPSYDRISIYHPLQGAQTSGSAASYAEKLFMRKAFKVVTGEDDADATDSESFKGVSLEDTFNDTDVKRVDDPVLDALKSSGPMTNEETSAEIQNNETDDATEAAPLSEDPKDFVDVNGSRVVLKEIKEPDIANWELVYKVFETFLPEMETQEKTKMFWTDNTRAVEMLKIGNPKLHKTLVDMFKEHKSKL